MRLPRRRVLLAALPLVLVTGVALAAQPGGRKASSAVIHACVKKNTGLVRIVAASAKCRRGESSDRVERPGRARRGRRSRRGRAHRARRVPRERPAPRATRARRRAGPGCRPTGPGGTRRPLAALAGEPERRRLSPGRSAGHRHAHLRRRRRRHAQVRPHGRRLERGDPRERVHDRLHGRGLERVRRALQRRLERGGRRRLQGRLPLLGGHERHHARHDPGRHQHPRGRLLPARRQRLPRLARGRPERSRPRSRRPAAASPSATRGGAILDSVGYGDTTNAFVEAHPATAPPATAAPGSSSGRIPDGHDTNDNAADFSVSATPSPGAANH